MINENQAKDEVAKYAPEVKIVSWAKFNDLYLIRIEWPSPEEANYDPYFSVDVNTGKVSEFSIIAYLDEVLSLTWTNF
jgi:hypothetical protein